MRMKFQLIQSCDTERLLRFELENRDWFEEYIEPRAASFYSPAGVAAHISENLDGYQRGILHPYVLLDENGQIIGRANLKEIDCAAASAEIGYRIAHRHTGKGLAGSAVAQLKIVAFSQLALRRVSAYVSIENTASAKVLEKNGFAKQGFFPQRARLKDKALDCHEYVHWNR